MTPEDRERLQGHLRLAESLGGEVAGSLDVGSPRRLLRYAREHNVTRIVIGKPTHSRWRDWFRGSLVNQLVRGSGDIEVHFIAGDEVPAPGRPQACAPAADRVARLRGRLALRRSGDRRGMLARGYLSQPDFVMMFLLTIMVVAFRYGRGPSLAVGDALGCGLRLLLRAAVLHLQRRARAAPAHLRDDVRRGHRHQQPHHATPASGARRPPCARAGPPRSTR